MRAWRVRAVGLLNVGKPKFSKIRGCVVGPGSLLNFGKSKFSEIRGRAVGAVVLLNSVNQNLAA